MNRTSIMKQTRHALINVKTHCNKIAEEAGDNNEDENIATRIIVHRYFRMRGQN